MRLPTIIALLCFIFPGALIGHAIETPNCESQLISTGNTDPLSMALVRYLNRPIRTKTDIERYLSILSRLSPRYATLIAAAKSNGVVFEIGSYSAASRTTQGVVNRDTTYAKRIMIKQGSPYAIFHIVHELCHASPLAAQKLSADFMTKSKPEATQELVEFLYKDEAYAVEAEIELAEVLRDHGFSVDFDKISPGALALYQKGGIELLARDFLKIKPGYKEIYPAMAAALVRAVSTNNSPDILWSSDGFSIVQNGNTLTMDINSEQLIEWIRRNLINDVVSDTETDIKRAINKLKSLFHGFMGTPVPSLPPEPAPPSSEAQADELSFEPRPEPAGAQTQATTITNAAEATKYRVNIMAKYLDLLNQSIAAKSDGNKYETYFHELLAQAEHSYGEASAQIYRKLHETLQAMPDPKNGYDSDSKRRNRRKYLGLSLLRSGYKKQGRAIFSSFIHGKGSLSWEDVIELLQTLVPLNEISLMEDLISMAERFLKGVRGQLAHSLGEEYEKDSTFTEHGRAAFDRFFRNHETGDLTAEEAFQFINRLREQGDLTVKSGHEYMFKRALVSYEDTHVERLYNLKDQMQKFFKIADEINENQEDLAPLKAKITQLAVAMAETSLAGAQRADTLQIEQWGAPYNPALSLPAYIRSVQDARPNTEYDFSRNFQSKQRALTFQLLKNQKTLKLALSLLQTLRPSPFVLEIYMAASENLEQGLSAPEVMAFIQSWKKALVVSTQAIKDDSFIENIFDGAGEIRNKNYLRTQDTGHHPQTDHEVHAYVINLIAMAKLLLGSRDPALQQQGIQMIEGLSESSSVFFNPHDYANPQRFLYGERTGGTLYISHTFRPLELKILALSEASKKYPAKAREWLDRALLLLEQVKIEVLQVSGTTWLQQEAKIWIHIQLIEALAHAQDNAAASYLSNSLRTSLSLLEADARLRLENFEKLPDVEKNKISYEEITDIKNWPATISIWQQYLDSVVRSNMAVAMAQSSIIPGAKSLAKDMVESFEKDVTNRRHRFDVKAMIASASSLADAPQLVELSVQAFQAALNKLALLRGDKDIFRQALVFFSKKVRACSLADPIKDDLLSKFITEISPPNDKDWSEMAENAAELIAVTNEIEKAGIYPKAEVQILKLYDRLAAKVSYERRDTSANAAKIAFAKILFTRIAQKHPELSASSNYQAVSSVSSDADFQKSLTVLLPVEAAKNRGTQAVGADGQFDLDQIRAGFYEFSTIGAKLRTELQLLVSQEHEEQKLLHLLEVYKEIIRQQLTAARNHLGTYEFLDLAQLQNITALADLIAIIEPKPSVAQTVLTKNEKHVLRAILNASDTEESNGKYKLYLSILGSRSAPLLAQRLAFEGYLVAKPGESYLANYYQNRIRSAEADQQTRFFRTVKRLLIDSIELPNSNLMPYFFEDAVRGDQFLENYLQTKKLVVVPDEFKRKNSELNLGSLFSGSEASFLTKRQTIIDALKASLWLSDLKSDDDIIIIFQRHFSFFARFDGYAESLRQIYVDRSYDINGPNDFKYTYSVDTLERNVRRIIPGFVAFTEAQKAALLRGFEATKDAYHNNSFNSVDRQAVRQIPKDRGTISYNFFTQEVLTNMSFDEDQRGKLIEFFKGSQWNDSMFLRIFGRPEMSVEELDALDARLTRLKLEFARYQELTDSASFQIPQVFAQQPGLVKFGLIAYFKLLPFGERRAILDEFEATSKGLTAEQAVRRFLELTGTEKIGQFLSTRRDLVPENYRREFEVFQQNIAPSSFEEVRSTIEGELGKPLSEVFTSVDPKALNVGTIGEVYVATLLTGEKVVVKVLTKSRRAAIKQMLSRLSEVARSFHKNRSNFSAAFNSLNLFNEFKRTILEELDFRIELENASLLRATLDDGMSIPEHFPQYAGESVLVQRFTKGVAPALVEDPNIRQQAVRRIGRHFLKNLLSTGIFHDDLHAGNFRIITASGEVELLDTGRIGRLTDLERTHLMPLLLALQAKNADDVISHLLAAENQTRNFDRVALRMKIETLMAISQNNSNLISEIFFEYGNAGLEVSAGYLQVLKGIMTFEGSAQLLDPTFKLNELM